MYIGEKPSSLDLSRCQLSLSSANRTTKYTPNHARIYLQQVTIPTSRLNSWTMSDNNAGDSVKQAGQKAAEAIEVASSLLSENRSG